MRVLVGQGATVEEIADQVVASVIKKVARITLMILITLTTLITPITLITLITREQGRAILQHPRGGQEPALLLLRHHQARPVSGPRAILPGAHPSNLSQAARAAGLTQLRTPLGLPMGPLWPSSGPPMDHLCNPNRYRCVIKNVRFAFWSCFPLRTCPPPC